MSLKDKFIAAVEKTGDPMASIKLQNAYAGAEALGKMMATIADEKKTRLHREWLLTLYSDAELETAPGTPEFICVLSAMLAEAIVEYGRKL